MSARKKQSPSTLQQLHASILDLLAKTKPHLNDSEIPNRPSLVQNLNKIASLAENFAEQRPRSTNSWDDLADKLDQEGVDLWNISGLVRTFSADDGHTLVAALRLAAFRLVEAGLEPKPGIDTLVHILRLASKTGNALSEAGQNNTAAAVLTSAAKYEERLKTANSLDKSQQQLVACATIVYFSSRMEAAWKEGNYTVAEYTLQMVMDDDQRLDHLPPQDRKLLIHQLYQIGKSLLKDQQEPNLIKPSAAIHWLRNAFKLADDLEEKKMPDVAELKISILRTMARAYFLDGAYDQAEATLDELIPVIDSSKDLGSSEYQELRWLRLAILKRRVAGENTLFDAFKSIIDHMEVSEKAVTDILQELRTITPYTLVTAVNHYCLQRALQCHGTGSDHTDRLLLSLIFHCAKDDDHGRAMKTLDAAFTSVVEAEVELRSIPCTACLTLIWQYGDRHYQAKRWPEAADWFLAGSHKLFKAESSTTYSKCFRKAAICYIEQKEYAKASTVIRRCPTHEAATHYVIFLTAIHQGLDDEAITAVKNMQKAPDFDRRMLLLATQLSHKLEMKPVLLSVLEILLKTLKSGANNEAIVEAMTLIRCIIKLALKLLMDPVANKPILMDTVVNHFRTAKILTEAASAQNAVPLIVKDISWLWRTAYNCAIQGCSEWSECTERIAELFDISRELLEASSNASPADMDCETGLHIVNASLAAVSARVYSIREFIASSGLIDRERLLAIAADIKASKNRVSNIISQHKVTEDTDVAHVQYVLHTLQIFETEFLVQLKDWERVSETVAAIVTSRSYTAETYEAIADILWTAKESPVNGASAAFALELYPSRTLTTNDNLSTVLYSCLEAILHASLEHNALSVEKFARWLRGLCTISLSRNCPGDRLKAIGYIEQALSVLEQYHDCDEPYPMDERQWLLAIAYNTGTECLQASLLDEGKRWIETAIVICRYVPGGKERAEKISSSYMQLLARYYPDKSC